MTKRSKLGPRLRGDDELGWRGLLGEAAERCGSDERLWAHFLGGLSEPVLRRILEEWHWQAHGGQRAPAEFDADQMTKAGHPPDGAACCIWLLMAGRGFGKTRAGAEWVWGKVRALRYAPSPGSSPVSVATQDERIGLRIALVGATREDAVRVMVEGPSGLIAVARPDEAVRWVPTRGELELGRHARAFVYSAEAAEALRGPEHHFAWCDELGKWGRPSTTRSALRSGRTDSRADAAWDNLMMGLRLGARPRVMVTTTPRSTPLMKRVMALPGSVVTRGQTGDNLHLPDAFKTWMAETYGGTRLGRQELDGEWIEEVEGSLFPVEMMEAARMLFPGEGRGPGAPKGAAGAAPWAPAFAGELKRIVVGVDPPASAGGDACGIVVCALLAGEPPAFVVLADHSVAGLRPDGWARAVARAAAAWGADRVVAEKNQGGDMVGAVLRGADCLLPVRLVHASRGKAARAEPVAALMEAGRVRLAGHFPELEAELNGLMAGGGYKGASQSPDRADACIWALATLIEGARRAGPRIVAL